MQSTALRHVIVSDVGRVRARNEDLAAADGRRGIYLLADGMGGHPDGNVAAELAVATAMRYITARSLPGRPRNRGEKLAAAIREANRAIVERARPSQAGPATMGTTLVCAWLGKRFLHLAHVGDSRAYCIRDSVAQRLTRDHTVVQALIDRGELLPDAPEVAQYGHILTQAVGLSEAVRPEVGRFVPVPGDVYLLCSDGLSDLVPDRAIAAIVTAYEDDIEAAAEALVAAALEAGGHDNVTVLLVRDQTARAADGAPL